MHIMIIRHGQTEWNKSERVQGWSDIGLNEYGISQVEKFCGLLKKDYWDLVISSDLIRAMQTARGIAIYLNIPMITMEKLRERNYGELEGFTRGELMNEYPQLNYLSTIPAGERYKAFYKRVRAGLQDIISEYSKCRLIIVTHNGVLQIISKYFGIVGEWDNLSYAEFVYENGDRKKQGAEVKSVIHNKRN